MQKESHLNNYRQELRGRILKTAIRLFKERGVKSVRMEDIAAVLSISKRTLYELYDNKELLLLEGVKDDCEGHTRRLAAFAEKADNEMEILGEAIRMNLEDLKQTTPVFFVDIQKYEKVKNYLMCQHEERRRHSIAFMQSGVEHGYFLAGMNYEITSVIGDAAMNYVMEHKLYERYSLDEIFRNFITVFLRGFCTEKGIRLLETFLE